MRYFVGSLAIAFALAHITAAFTQFKSQDSTARGSAIMLVCGGIETVCGGIVHLLGGWHTDLIFLVTGAILICFAAYLNGRRSGNLHLSHHLIRGGIAVLLVTGFAIW